MGFKGYEFPDEKDILKKTVSERCVYDFTFKKYFPGQACFIFHMSLKEVHVLSLIPVVDYVIKMLLTCSRALVNF